MTERANDISFDPKTWLSEPSTLAVAAPAMPAVAGTAVATPTSRSRTALAFGLSALLLVAAAAGAYLTRVPLLAPPAAALR